MISFLVSAFFIVTGLVILAFFVLGAWKLASVLFGVPWLLKRDKLKMPTYSGTNGETAKYSKDAYTYVGKRRKDDNGSSE